MAAFIHFYGLSPREYDQISVIEREAMSSYMRRWVKAQQDAADGARRGA